MRIRYHVLTVLVLAGCATPAATAPEPSHQPVTVTLRGAVEKGPFLLGSSVSVMPAAALSPQKETAASAAVAADTDADESAAVAGQVFKTETTNDRGEFELSVAYQGFATIEGTGFYYNEATGALSHAPITLRASHEIGVSDESVQVNLITHLTHQRIKRLVSQGAIVADATVQAESELQTELGLGVLSKEGNEVSLTGGDNDSAYLFAVSTLFAQAGYLAATASNVDASLQELLNTTAADFAESGMVSDTVKDRLAFARKSIDNKLVMANFATRLRTIGATASVPDLERIIPWHVPESVQACADTMPQGFDMECRLVACGNNLREPYSEHLPAQQQDLSECDPACWANVACVTESCSQVLSNGSRDFIRDGFDACLSECGIAPASIQDTLRRADWIWRAAPTCF